MGALWAVAAITLPPLLVVLVAATALRHVSHAPRFVGAECGVVVASAGLLLATAYRVLGTIVRRRAAALALAAAVAFAVGTHFIGMPVATLAALAMGFAFDLGLRSRA